MKKTKEEHATMRGEVLRAQLVYGMHLIDCAIERAHGTAACCRLDLARTAR